MRRLTTTVLLRQIQQVSVESTMHCPGSKVCASLMFAIFAQRQLSRPCHSSTRRCCIQYYILLSFCQQGGEHCAKSQLLLLGRCFPPLQCGDRPILAHLLHAIQGDQRAVCSSENRKRWDASLPLGVPHAQACHFGRCANPKLPFDEA